ncbi:MAG TPA: hypothetical protein VJ440_09225 [Candidatus Brocadiaceae bacterium]|nr:hypothetical protein [Candidatus Brocadiaceae bacterium]
MPSSLIAIILTSSVVAGLVTFVLNMYKEERILRRQKLEALYLYASNWIRLLAIFGLNHGSAMRGTLTLNQVNDLIIKYGSDEKNNFENMNMLVGLYFPRLQGGIDELMKCRESLNALIKIFKQRYKNGETDGSMLLPEFKEIMDRLDNAEEKFKNAVFREAALINRPWAKLRP